MRNLFPPPQAVPSVREARIRDVVLAEPAADRDRKRRARRRWGVRLAAAGLAGVAVATWLLAFPASSPRRRPALASWTAVPIPVSPAATRNLAASCAREVARSHFPIRLGRVTSAVADRRGSFTAVVLQGATGREATCLHSSRRFSDVGVSSDSIGIYPTGKVHGALTIDDTQRAGVGLGAAAAKRVVAGRAVPRVSKVVLHTADGEAVTASLANGHFLAWWPSWARVTRAQAFDSSGRLIASVKGPRNQGTATPPTPRHR